MKDLLTIKEAVELATQLGGNPTHGKTERGSNYIDFANGRRLRISDHEAIYAKCAADAHIIADQVPVNHFHDLQDGLRNFVRLIDREYFMITICGLIRSH